MKIIKKGDKKVVGIISKKKILQDALYRVSGFVYPFAEKGVYLLRNTLSGQVASLTEKEWDAFQRLTAEPKDSSFLEENGLTELACLCFIVESNHSEAEQYRQVSDILNIMLSKKPGLKTYTILPTTCCNARCVYCYEESIRQVTMSKETADRLIDYICETRCEDEITLSWFGGEPLLAHKTISYVCQMLKDRDVPFRSKMVTNASLLTKEVAHTAKELWNLKKVQVSLDGMPSDYEERKRYRQPEKHNHETVIRSIHYLADEGININLRINFDRNNISGIKEYLAFLRKEFADNENVSAYLGILFQEKHTDQYLELYRKVFELSRYMREIGLPQGSKDKKQAGFKINYCMADSMDSSIVIDPQGKLYNCEHMPENRTWGSIFDGCTDTELYENLKQPADIDEKCRECTFLPYCTPFYKNGCPGWFEHCRDYMEIKTFYALGNIASTIKTQ